MNIFIRGDEKGEIFKIAKQMPRTNQDVAEENCIRNDHGDLAFDDCEKHGKSMENYYNRLLNKENGDKDGLSFADPILGPAIRIKIEWMEKA